MAVVLGRIFCSRLRWCLHHHDFKRCLSKIGFIGLGNMGLPMARNLLQKGHRLTVFDTNPQAVAHLVEDGAVAAKNPADLAGQVECVVTMLPNSCNVLQVYKGPDGVFENTNAGTLIIDSSTIDPSIPQELSAYAEKEGAVFLDAPVSGGVQAAESGQLTFMVGGSAEEFEAAKELLLCMGSQAIYCGPSGSGLGVKICNNMLLGISMVGAAEAMNLGIRLGLDPKLLLSVINTSSGRCWSTEVYSPVPGTTETAPSARNYEDKQLFGQSVGMESVTLAVESILNNQAVTRWFIPTWFHPLLPPANDSCGGFGTQLMTKDLGLVQNAATQSRTPIPLGSLTHQIYRTMVQKGFARKDFSSVYEFLSQVDDDDSG